MNNVAAALILGLSLASSAQAGPALSLTWDGYPGTQNRSRSAGSPATAVLTAVGFDRPVKGIDVRLVLGSNYTSLPNAWRYDPGGCAAGGFNTPETPANAGTPFLTGLNLGRFSNVQYEYGREAFIYANLHDPAPVNTAQRYTIAKFEFDHEATFDGPGVRPDSCGCVEQPLCLRILQATWFDQDGVEIPFVIAQEYISWEDPINSLSCPIGCDLCTDPVPPNPCNDSEPTATVQRTWGALRASYR